MKKWILATRPWSFPASAMPVIITVAYLFFTNQNHEHIEWLYALPALLGAIIFQAAGNLISDYFDYQHGVDSHDNIGLTNLTIVDGVFKAGTILRFGISLLAAGAFIGLFFVWKCGLPVLWIGIGGFLLTLFYYKLKYSALGDAAIFILFGLLISLGTAFIMTGELVFRVLMVSAPVGFLIVGILHSNNTRDINTDQKANIKTFAMILGVRASKIYYLILNLCAFLFIMFNIATGVLHYASLLVLLSAPISFKNVMRMLKCKQMKDIDNLDGESAKLVMLFSLLLSLSCVIAFYLI